MNSWRRSPVVSPQKPAAAASPTVTSVALRALALDHLARDCAKEEAGQDLKVLGRCTRAVLSTTNADGTSVEDASASQ
eukprot:CAMPEP_0181489272 /NCGR_PEP_ID=MMETSP1110-20121109/48875_1 /TAXON_ID=174948 /ORGANISM="Symbiodinium sp., Strain CCMP421" /LENGTH=77 /DNA_ID=CAMNT_0023616057 /DNA_START=69 /DNA_END=302 /DNA_ORIENTATION=-